MIDRLLHSVREGELWIEDRNFCTRRLMFGMARRGASFLVRQHAQLQGELLGTPKRTGVTRSGTVYEQAMIVRDPASDETMCVRRLTLALKAPTRDGATELHILSHIPVADARASKMIAIPAPHWAVFREMSPAEFAGVLRELASSVKLSKYRKHPRGPKKKPPERTAYKNGSHVATARLIAQR